jgi:hypothetical protein
MNTRGRVPILIVCLVAMATAVFAQPLPQIGSLPRGSGGGTPVGTNIFTGTNATSQFITNVILSLDLWTNDLDGVTTFLRPVDKARSLLHRQMSSNYFGLYLETQVTNDQNFNLSGWFVNKTTNSAAKGAYYWDGAIAGVFESDPELGALKSGDGVGLLGVADGWWTKQIGLAGYAESIGNNQTNIGVHASSLSNGKTGTTRVGLYAETGVDLRAAVTDHPMVSGVIVGDSRSSGDSLLRLGTNNGTLLFQVNPAGDLVILNAAAAGKVLRAQDSSGLAKWETVAFGVGPGTNNFLAKFDSTGTNVVNSLLFSDRTNSIELRQAFDPSISHTNSATNRIGYGEWTNVGTNQWLELVVPKGHNNEAAHLRHMAIGQANQRNPLYLQDSWVFEPDTNKLSGHTARALYPVENNLAIFGDVSHQIFSATFGSGGIHFETLAATPPAIAGIAVGGQSGGMDFHPEGVSFFRPNTGITAAFNKERNSGTAQLDVAGNMIGFGNGMSNTVAHLKQSGLNGLIEMGTNNSGAAPIGQGFVGPRGVGTDIAAGDALLGGGRSTGAGLPGRIKLQTVNPGASSATLNTLIDRVVIDTNTVTINSNLVVGGTITASGLSGSTSNSILELRDTPGAIYLSSYGTNKLTSFGTNTADMTTISNGLLSASQSQYSTNVSTMAPDFKLGYSTITTNAAFTLLAPINVIPTKAETCVMLVTNSTAAAVVITPAAGWKSQGVWYVTNLTSITVSHYGNVITNATALPLF